MFVLAILVVGLVIKFSAKENSFGVSISSKVMKHGVVMSYNNEFDPILILEKDDEFIDFSVEFNIDMDKLHDKNYKHVEVQELSSDIYDYKLSEKESLIIVKTINKFHYFYTKSDSKGIDKIYDKDSNNILDIADKSRLECVRDTVAFMRSACSNNITCNFMCDLMSTDCTRQMYIVAYAHCLASGDESPLDTSDPVLPS